MVNVANLELTPEEERLIHRLREARQDRKDGAFVIRTIPLNETSITTLSEMIPVKLASLPVKVYSAMTSLMDGLDEKHKPIWYVFHYDPPLMKVFELKSTK